MLIYELKLNSIQLTIMEYNNMTRNNPSFYLDYCIVMDSSIKTDALLNVENKAMIFNECIITNVTNYVLANLNGAKTCLLSEHCSRLVIQWILN